MIRPKEWNCNSLVNFFEKKGSKLEKKTPKKGGSGCRRSLVGFHNGAERLVGAADGPAIVVRPKRRPNDARGQRGARGAAGGGVGKITYRTVAVERRHGAWVRRAEAGLGLLNGRNG